MNYQRAGYLAIFQRISGWILFIFSSLSTVISILNFLYLHSKQDKGINAVAMDFIHVMVDAIHYSTKFLDIFWHNSPIPELGKGITWDNILFLIIYWLAFVGLALTVTGARISRQIRFIRERLDDKLILEQLKGSEGLTRQQLEEKIVLPNHTILRQIFPLYVLPVLVLIVGYFLLNQFISV